ncbi:DNA damage-inducible transcript 3 protein [Gracilinanus agilis]|uniref:DNA damage-inducible transcript 3 protein n=1 Tax=Gracilinanus agilis TaxID=191870 RepID=UPI001CFD466E|nr:DNA damage-inducible transcript 3 protein [Gracilinanus agilis]XP_044535871.1 DNA damage-inducible transcript 3 protein [Gracilinanus agilis]
MAAEPLPFSFGTLSSWELEAWYEDLQEVLSSEENGGAYVQPPETEQEELKTFTTLDPASLVWLAEEPGPVGITTNGQSPCSPESSQSSLAQEEEEEEQGEQGRGRNRKRRRSEQSPARGRKQSVKEKEQENERKVAHLEAENERLKREIERLTREVDVTRQALIDRMVSLPRS